MQTLRFKILGLAGLLVLVTQLGTVGAVLFTANREVRAQTGRILERASLLSQPLAEERGVRLRIAGSVLAANAHFRAAIASGDMTRAAEILATQRRLTRVDLGLLLDGQGHVLASTGLDGVMGTRYPELVGQASDSSPSRATAKAGARTYEVSTLPVGDGPSRAWLAMGTVLDNNFAQRLSRLTGLNATLLTGTGHTPSVLGTSLPRQDALALLNDLHLAGARAGIPMKVHAGDVSHVAIVLPLIPGNADVEVMLSQTLDTVIAPFESLRLAVLLLSFAALCLALAGGLILSRAISAPVQALVGAARRIRDGDYRQPVAVRADGEVAELMHALNAMQDGIAEREARITYQARFDALTGLPTRLSAQEALQASIKDAQRRGRPVTIMLVDLNNFSEIGASLGHDLGDALRCQAAERLRAGLDARHLLARLEGDQFLVLLAGCALDDAEEIADDLLRLLGAGLSVREVSVSVEPRVALAAYPQHAEDADELLKRVAVACNEARSAGTPVCVYQPGNEERQVRQLAILADIRRATRHDELRLYLQPKIRLSDGRICGAEALVRWQHPVFGFLTPDKFIPLAEKSGNISLITQWALTASVRECRLWLEEGLDLPVSVNLSSRDLQNRDLPVFILELLRNHDLPPRNLAVEITEEAVVQDTEHASVVLECLHDLGIRLSMDDFGTGYSSLAQLKNLAVDEVKIDRSFVMDLPASNADAAIVRTAIDLAHNLGLQVLAEGVETQPALEWLRQQGCEQAQGYLISKPMPADEFPAWVRNYEKDDTRPLAVLQIAS